MIDQAKNIRELRPGSTGWTGDDLETPENRWRWENARYEMREGVIACPGYGPDTAERLVPGSTGWSAADLDRPPFAQQWREGRYELINGVIAEMSPPALSHSFPVNRLLSALDRYYADQDVQAVVASEVDLYLDEHRIFTVDGLLMLPDDLAAEKDYLREAGLPPDWIGRVHVPPMLIIESVSEGHESHDYDVKRKHFERFGVRNYWVVNARDHRILCLKHEGQAFAEDTGAINPQRFQPGAFPGLSIDLHRVFLG